MPRFCGACGFIGHSHLECGTGEHFEEELKWGEWLKVNWEDVLAGEVEESDSRNLVVVVTIEINLVVEPIISRVGDIMPCLMVRARQILIPH
jgi:hypothetical protein